LSSSTYRKRRVFVMYEILKNQWFISIACSIIGAASVYYITYRFSVKSKAQHLKKRKNGQYLNIAATSMGAFLISLLSNFVANYYIEAYDSKYYIFPSIIIVLILYLHNHMYVCEENESEDAIKEQEREDVLPRIELNAIWSKAVVEAELICKNNNIVAAHPERFAKFEKAFQEKYVQTREKNMWGERANLDRHKVAAIIIYAIIETNIIECTVNIKGLFQDNYRLAVSVGLSFLQDECNRMLKGKKLSLIEKMKFPEVFEGEESYETHLIKMLYYSNEDSNSENRKRDTDILALSNILFLIEYINIRK